MAGKDISLLGELALDYGVPLSPAQIRLFGIYLEELWDWNRHVNLVGVDSRERVMRELFLDALAPAPHLPLRGSLLDMGSGSGLPGLPLKIYRPDLHVTLIDIKSKKISFLKHVTRLMGLSDVEIMRIRLEENAPPEGPLRKGYSVVTARAFSGLGTTVRLATGLLAPGGRLAVFMGRDAEKDLREHGEIIKKAGFDLRRTIPYKLPGKPFPRAVLLFSKKNGS